MSKLRITVFLCLLSLTLPWSDLKAVSENALGPFFPFVPSSAPTPTPSLSANQALFDIISEPTVAKVAPGELLPVSVKLSNFGYGRRVDVLIEYSILTSTGVEIYLVSETVAVETTANFIKLIQIPLDTKPGTLIAKTAITYHGQLTSATAQFPFEVERRILGLFKSDFIIYGLVTLSLGVIMMLLGRIIIKRRRARFAPLDYPAIARDRRPFYEILSDTIMTMRGRVGDKALLVASGVDGLKIDLDTGRVLSLKASPAKIIAKLVSEYEKLLGKKVSFTFRQPTVNR